MKLLADCGSTKIDWCLLNSGKLEKQFFTAGLNAIMLTEEDMVRRIADELVPNITGYDIDSIYFYGAGCISDEVCNNVANALKVNVPDVKIVEVHSDLLAAARALCGSNPGIACILGTGSNSCYYDGNEICDNVSPLGYILGDEGSGAVIGKTFLGDVLKNQLSKEISNKFLAQYNLDRLTVIRRVYKEPQGNRFLASVTPFLSENIDNPEIHAIVKNSFVSFFKRNIAQYRDYQKLAVNFVGSIAYYFQDVLREASNEVGCHIGTIIKSPMEGLVQYHQK
jgi:N-acetylglucosamine kinase-like BadF-type ATPase